MDSEPGRSVEAHFLVSGVVFLFDSVFGRLRRSRFYFWWKIYR